MLRSGGGRDIVRAGAHTTARDANSVDGHAAAGNAVAIAGRATVMKVANEAGLRATSATSAVLLAQGAVSEAQAQLEKLRQSDRPAAMRDDHNKRVTALERMRASLRSTLEAADSGGTTDTKNGSPDSEDEKRSRSGKKTTTSSSRIVVPGSSGSAASGDPASSGLDSPGGGIDD